MQVGGSYLVDGVAEEGGEQPWEQQQHHKQNPQGSLPPSSAAGDVGLNEEVLDGGKVTGRWELRTPAPMWSGQRMGNTHERQ